jgi:6,7-dimethyl-8-ribityllumazine synthase
LDHVRLGIIVSEFNKEITFVMLDNAKKQAGKMKALISHICYVPGSFDMPLILKELLRKEDVDAVVTLGTVIKGETKHDEIVAENAARLIADLSVQHGKPVALGITGPGITFEQAMNRAEIVPVRAVIAAVEMTDRLRKMKENKSAGEQKS